MAIGHKNKLSWVSYQPEPLCYHFLTYKWVFVSHQTETDGTETNVGTCSGWLGALFDNLCGKFLGQHARSLALVWVCMIRNHVVGAPSFWGSSCLFPHFCTNVLKREVTLLLSNSSLPFLASLPAWGASIPAETCGEQVRRNVLSVYLLDPWTGPACRGRAGGGQVEEGSSRDQNRPECTRSKNAEEKEKQMWEEGRFQSPAMVSWVLNASPS